MARTISLECPPQSPTRISVRDAHRYPPNAAANPSPLATIASSNPQPSDSIVIDLQNDSTREEKDVVAPADRSLLRTPDPTPSEEFLLTHKARECNWARILDWRRYKNPRVFCSFALFQFMTVFDFRLTGYGLQGRSR